VIQIVCSSVSLVHPRNINAFSRWTDSNGFGWRTATAAELGFEGKWLRADGNALVRIASCGSRICVTNLWIADTSKGESVGDQLLMSLTPSSANTFSGTAHDPKRKLNYSIVIKIQKGGLMTRGCFIGKLVCKDVSWTEAN
jgi:uncharacterized protein (DUF2147 family)